MFPAGMWRPSHLRCQPFTCHPWLTFYTDASVQRPRTTRSWTVTTLKVMRHWMTSRWLSRAAGVVPPVARGRIISLLPSKAVELAAFRSCSQSQRYRCVCYGFTNSFCGGLLNRYTSFISTNLCVTNAFKTSVSS